MKKNIIVKQQDIKDCGVCCLESIIRYYNGYIPLETLRLDTKTSINGTTAYNIIKTAKKYGFNAYGRKIKDIDIKDISLPVIAHITTKKGLNHFVVIYKISNSIFHIMDPAKGMIKVKKEDFYQEWTNIILIFKPYKKIPLLKIKNNIKELFIKIVNQESNLIKEIILINILISITSIILGYYLKVIINIINNEYINVLIFGLSFFLIINILKIIFTYLKSNLITYLNKNIDLTIIPDFISHIINLPLDVIKSRTSGEILTRIEELNNIKNLFTEIYVTVILNLTIVLIGSIFLYSISNQLFLILCIITLLYIIVSIIASKILKSKINDSIELETEFNSLVSEKISSLETIKNLSLSKKVINELEESYVTYESSYFEVSKVFNIIHLYKNSIQEIGLFIINALGIYLIYRSELSLLSLITFNSLVSYFLEPITSIIEQIPKYQYIKLSFNKISEFLEIEGEQEGPLEEFINGNITFKNITYSYNDYENILNNISLSIFKNSHVIIKGKTGCGKSTLLKMLNKNVTGYKGKITINDINIKDYSLSTLRKNIIYVSQKEKLFSDTIGNNITLGNKYKKDELNKVLRLTEVDKILDKKSTRLETFLYDSGSNLSGGERQRIVLARALLSKPLILILDESLSEVDKDTEHRILTSLNKYYKDTTIIYITHTNTSAFKNIIEMEKLHVK